MVCCTHLKSRYTRFLLEYHLLIFIFSWMMSSICIGLLIYKSDRIHRGNLLQGFQVHGTKSSDDYRKYLALLRETQLAHLFPHSINSKTFQQIPYASYQAHNNPCTKRFYRSTCPIMSYIELTFAVNMSSLFHNVDQWKSICRLEWNLRKNFTNCSSSSCCEYIGAVNLLIDNQFDSIEQCENITDIQLKDIHSQWLSCQSSSCSNEYLQHYLSYVQSSSNLKIYLHLIDHANQSRDLIDLYNYLSFNRNEFTLIEMDLPLIDQEYLFSYLLTDHFLFILLTLIFYLICLIFFVKNLVFLLTILQQIFLTLLCTWTIYQTIFHLPLTILTSTSLIFYFILMLLDSSLWYTCWFVNHHRRDDCPIEQLIESLLIQIFYYILPKNLTAMIVLIITYSNQIIAFQYCTIFAFLLLIISFLLSFLLYPVTFIIILRYQSIIPSFEQCRNIFLTNRLTHCLMNHTIPYLIVRFKAFWLTLFPILAGLSLVVIFYWPKLQFDVCHITFDVLPSRSLVPRNRTIDIDVTYYIGSHWEMPNESFVPLEDIPLLDYNWENRMTSKPGQANTFEYALEKNLSKFIQFCAYVKGFDERSISDDEKISYRHYHRHSRSQIFSNHSVSIKDHALIKPNNLHCFGAIPLLSPSNSSLNTKFSSIITNQSTNCLTHCHSTTYDCILCLNSIYYHSIISNDLVVLKNGLRFISDVQYPRYLFQTINYHWTIESDLKNYSEWKIFGDYFRTNIFSQFYSQIFPQMSIWWSSEIVATWTILEQLQRSKSWLITIQFLLVLIFLLLFTGILGLFVTLTTLLNFIISMAIFTLLDMKLTIENLSYFTIVFIVCSQYSVLYSISYKFAPTFFFQRENRTMYSLKQLCTTLLHVTLAILLICLPCLFTSLPYLFKSAMIYTISSVISFISSTFFLQSLLCYLGPADQTCSLLPWHMKCRHRLSMMKINQDCLLRKTSTHSRRHQRASTSSYFASSHFSQILTGSTYFESEYGGMNDISIMSSRRRESSRSYQLSHTIKRNSILTGEMIELYTPRASLSPYGHHYHHRYSRHSSVPRTAPVRPLYISPSVSPHSQSSLHSQAVSRQHSLSPQLPTTPTSASLRPCNSAPRLQTALQRIPKQIDIIPTSLTKKSSITIQRQNAISIMNDPEPISAATKRHLLKETINESPGTILWLKRSNSS